VSCCCIDDGCGLGFCVVNATGFQDGASVLMVSHEGSIVGSILGVELGVELGIELGVVLGETVG